MFEGSPLGLREVEQDDRFGDQSNLYILSAQSQITNTVWYLASDMFASESDSLPTSISSCDLNLWVTIFNSLFSALVYELFVESWCC
jgi:hypothetical protein